MTITLPNVQTSKLSIVSESFVFISTTLHIHCEGNITAILVFWWCPEGVWTKTQKKHCPCWLCTPEGWTKALIVRENNFWFSEIMSNLEVTLSHFWQFVTHWKNGQKANLNVSCEAGKLHLEFSANLDHPDLQHFTMPTTKNLSPSRLRRNTGLHF